MGDPATRSQPPGRHVPADRYGAPPGVTRTRATYAVGAIATLVALAALLTLAVHTSSPAVSAGLRGYDVVSDSTVRIRFEVHKAPLAQAECTVRARDASGLETGRAAVTVGARGDSRRITEVTYDLTTGARAVTGELVGCRISRDH